MYNSQRLEKWTKNQRKNRYYTKRGIVEISFNSEKSRRDLQNLAVTQTLAKDPQLIPAWNTITTTNNNNNNNNNNTVDASMQRLEDYIEKHERGRITTIRNDTDNTIDERVTTTRKQKLEGKQLYGHFKRLINNISHKKNLDLAKKRKL